MSETERRRKIQQKYNEEHGITPQTIKKQISDLIKIGAAEDAPKKGKKKHLTRREMDEEIQRLLDEMQKASKELRFEEAAYLRDRIRSLETTKAGK